MNRTALYRALVEAGASEERAKEAAESVVYGREAATRSDIAEVNANIAEVNANVAEVNTNVATKLAEAKENVATKFAEVETSIARGRAEVAEVRTEVAEVRAELTSAIAALEVRFERSLREFSFRITALLVASQALLFAALRLTGTA